MLIQGSVRGLWRLAAAWPDKREREREREQAEARDSFLAMGTADTLFRLTCASLAGAAALTGAWLSASMYKGYRDASEFEVRRDGAGRGRRGGGRCPPDGKNLFAC